MRRTSKTTRNSKAARTVSTATTRRSNRQEPRRKSLARRSIIVRRTTVATSVLALDLVDEPLLQFAGGQVAHNPKEGIADSGPFTVGLEGQHPASLALGLV